MVITSCLRVKTPLFFHRSPAWAKLKPIYIALVTCADDFHQFKLLKRTYPHFVNPDYFLADSKYGKLYIASY